MKPAEQNTKKPFAATGIFAMLCGFLHVKGTGAPASTLAVNLNKTTTNAASSLARLSPQALLRSLILACLLSLTLFALFTAPAHAEVLHKYESQITEVPAGAKTVGGEAAVTGPLRQVNAIAIDSGDLWVAEELDGQSDPVNSRLDEFDASTHAFLEQFNQDADIGADGIAVGHATGEARLYNGTGGGGVAVLDPVTGDRIATWTGAETPAQSFGYSGAKDVAVDNALGLDEGDVYVADSAQNEGCRDIPPAETCVPPPPPQDEQVVDVFAPQAGGGERYLTQLTGACPTEDMTVGGSGCEEGNGLIPFPISEHMEVAVDQASGDVLVAPGGPVDVFEPLALDQYRFVRQLPVGGVSAVGGGEDNGDIYAGPSQFSPAGVFLGELAGTPAGPFSSVQSVAVDDETGEHVYVGDFNGGGATVGGVAVKTGVIDEFGPNIVIPDVTTTAATEATPTGARLNGEVDPLQAEAHEGAECWFVWGTTTAFGKEASCEPEQVPEHEGFLPVVAKIGELQPDTTYYYRLQARNKNETNLGKESETQHFTTPGPGIHSESVSDVASTSATLEATIDPNRAATTYYFQYGAGASYEYEAPAAPGSVIGSGEADMQVSREVRENLVPGTVYHYRVVAVSEIELEGGQRETKEFDGEDHTFTTLPPSGGGSAFPDNRQWELVSPPDKHGALVEPITESGVIEAAAQGGAFTYIASAPTESQPQGNARYAQVLATRGAAGWSDRDIATRSEIATGLTFGDGQEYRFFSPDLSRALFESRFYVDSSGFTTFPGEETSPHATEETPYLRENFGCPSATCYTPLLTELPEGDVTSGAKYGQGANYI
jgi:hypothetical protein